MYCTYLTIYRGNRLPPFYIGRTTVAAITNGYRGSVSSRMYKETWKAEIRDNPELFHTIILTRHVNKKESAEREERFHASLQVHKNPMYINMATASGDFYTSHKGAENFWFGKDRSGERNPMYGRRHSERTKTLISKNSKGKNKGVPKSKEHVQRVRESLSGRTYEDLHGKDKAERVKEKLRGPKTEAHIANLRASVKTAHSKIRVCPHCDKEVRGSSNFSRWHGFNCKSYQRNDESIQDAPVRA